MAVNAYGHPVASGQGREATPLKGGDLIERIAYFERLSSIVRQQQAPDAIADHNELLQSSACFDAWARPDLPRH